MHEASLHAENCFLTLTYDRENLPYGGTLEKRHFQLFMKRLRKFCYPERIKYFMCGEYGDRYRRPHYHACVFGIDFPDKTFFKEKNGHKLYRSSALEKLWPLGSSLIGDVTFESAAYVARYITAKITGPEAEGWYQNVEPDTGEIVSVIPEYNAMSLKPAIAKGWFQLYADETYSSDSVVARGLEMKPPKYYDKLFEELDPVTYEELKSLRRTEAKKAKNKANSTPERLAVREKVKAAQVTQLKREIE